MGPGVEFEEGAQLAFGLVEPKPGIGDGGQLHAKTVGRGAQRVALHGHLFGEEETPAFERADGLIRQRQRLGQVRGRERAFFEHAENGGGRVVRRGVEEQLARGVATGVGERPDLAAADIGGQRQHAAQHFAQGRAVVAGDPAAQGEELGIQHRFGIDQAHGLARRDGGGPVVTTEDDAGELAGSEGHHDAAAGTRPMAQGFRQGVGEGPVKRRGHADVAVKKGALGHEFQDSGNTGRAISGWAFRGGMAALPRFGVIRPGGEKTGFRQRHHPVSWIRPNYLPSAPCI